MAASPHADLSEPQARKWDHEAGPGPIHDVSDDHRGGRAGDPGAGNPDHVRGEPAPASTSGSLIYREKEIKPNKVYIGGLPDHTRQEDLQNCFGEMGNISNIELKVGFGFVEFDTKEAAEASVAKYNDGVFMGSKIRVEMSRGGGRSAKFRGDPDACFKCGETGHWARDCPNHVVSAPRRGGPPGDAVLVDRSHSSRDYPPPPPRDYPPYREEYAPRSYAPPPRDGRYAYDYPPPRRPISPPRDHRDYPPMPPPRDVDDYRMRGGPPPPPRYDARYPPDDAARYAPRGYPPHDYARHDRHPPPPPPGDTRYAPYPPPPGARPRTPALPARPPPEEFDRPPVREYIPPPGEYRGRPVTPPGSRYAEYPPPRSADARPRRRSQSPPARAPPAAYEAYAPGPAPGYGGPPPPPPNAGRGYPSPHGAVDYRRP